MATRLNIHIITASGSLPHLPSFFSSSFFLRIYVCGDQLICTPEDSLFKRNTGLSHRPGRYNIIVLSLLYYILPTLKVRRRD